MPVSAALCRRRRRRVMSRRRLGVVRNRGLLIRPAVLRFGRRVIWMARPRLSRLRRTAPVPLTATAPAGLASRLALAAVVAMLTAALPLQYRLRLRIAVRLEPGNDFLRYIAFYQPFDITQIHVLVHAN